MFVESRPTSSGNLDSGLKKNENIVAVRQTPETSKASEKRKYKKLSSNLTDEEKTYLSTPKFKHIKSSVEASTIKEESENP